MAKGETGRQLGAGRDGSTAEWLILARANSSLLLSQSLCSTIPTAVKDGRKSKVPLAVHRDCPSLHSGSQRASV